MIDMWILSMESTDQRVTWGLSARLFAFCTMGIQSLDIAVAVINKHGCGFGHRNPVRFPFSVLPIRGKVLSSLLTSSTLQRRQAMQQICFRLWSDSLP